MQMAGIGNCVDQVNNQVLAGNVIGAMDTAGAKINLLSEGNTNLTGIGTNSATQLSQINQLAGTNIGTQLLQPTQV